MRMRPPAWLVVVLLGALAGLVFAGVSTYDFVQHLDRQVHSLHCSFIPGAGARDRSNRLSGRDDELVLVRVPDERSGVAFRSRSPRWRCSRSSCSTASICSSRAARTIRARRRSSRSRPGCRQLTSLDHADHLADEARHDVQAVRRHLHRECALLDRQRWRCGGARSRCARRRPTIATAKSGRHVARSASRGARSRRMQFLGGMVRRRCRVRRRADPHLLHAPPITVGSSARAASSRSRKTPTT